MSAPAPEETRAFPSDSTAGASPANRPEAGPSWAAAHRQAGSPLGVLAVVSAALFLASLVVGSVAAHGAAFVNPWSAAASPTSPPTPVQSGGPLSCSWARLSRWRSMPARSRHG